MEEKELNKKEKRTLLIVSLAIVIALVFGISYAYFMAVGQSSEQTVTTANLKLAFNGNTPLINSDKEMSPITVDKIKSEGIKKSFTIAKEQTSSDMYVKIELTSVAITENLKDYDFKWALYEESNKITTGTFVPLKSSNSIILTNNVLINSTTPKNYELYIWIDETNLDQHRLQNGSFTGKITVTGFKDKTNTLASKILGENNINVTSGEFNYSTDFEDTGNLSSNSYKILNAKYTSGLYVQQANSETDKRSEFGFPTYYYRGDVSNNYVKFGTYKSDVEIVTNDFYPYRNFIRNTGDPIIWRIVRINEDGSIKLIMDDMLPRGFWDEENVSKYINDDGTDSNIKETIETWYTNNLAGTKYDNKVVTYPYCSDISGIDFNTQSSTGNAYARLYNETNPQPIFTCPAGSIIANEKIGLITADEAMYSGVLTYKQGVVDNVKAYMSNRTWSTWPFFTLTPGRSNSVIRYETSNNYLMSLQTITEDVIVPTITLSPDVVVSSGNGSIETPYIIE